MNHSYRFLVATFTILVLFSSRMEARQIWIATNGNDTTGTGSAAFPYRTLTHGYAVASISQLDTIMVKPGIYIDSVNAIRKDVVFKSQSGAGSTIIDGSGNIPITFTEVSAKTILEGFTVRNGGYAGIFINGTFSAPSSPEITNCIVRANPENGIYLYLSKANIHHNQIVDNLSDYARGINCSFSSPQIWNNLIQRNGSTSEGIGGGLYLWREFDSTIYSLVQNNLFLENEASIVGGAIYLYSDKVLILNNLFWRNSASGSRGGGIYFGNPYGTDVKIENNIFLENDNYALSCPGGDRAGLIVRYNCFYNNTPLQPASDCSVDNTNLTTVNPLLVNPAVGDFRLQPASLLIDAGVAPPVESKTVDYVDYPRVYYGLIDIGPYEWVECNLLADFVVASPSSCAKQTILFTDRHSGRYETAAWDYGNGDRDTFYYYSTVVNPQTTYNLRGSYVVRQIISDFCVVDTHQLTITVLDKPDAQFTFNPAQGCAPFNVSFSNASIGGSLQFRWDFGDTDTSSETNPGHLFQQPGNYQVKLLAINSCGADSLIKTVTVADLAVAYFKPASASGTPPLTVMFTDSSDNNPTEWDWDFGDGGTSTERNPQHTYARSGRYDVSLTVRSSCGESEPFERSDCVTAYGFDLSHLSTDSTDRFRPTFLVSLDTLYGLFSRQVSFSTVLDRIPRRGSAQFTVLPATTLPPESLSVTAALSPTLAEGFYQARLIGATQGADVADTIFLPFYAHPDPLIQLASTTLDFDSVEVDSEKIDSLLIRNVGPFGPNPQEYFLNIQGVASNDSQFTPLNPQSSSPIPPAGGIYYLKIKFRPRSLTAIEGTLEIDSDDPLYPQLAVQVKGVGITERRPPVVIATLPADESDAVLIGTGVEVQFSEPISPSSFTDESVNVLSARLGSAVMGSTALINSTTAHFLPAERFPPFDTVTVALRSTVTDLVGNGLDGNRDGIGSKTAVDDVRFTFTTGPAMYPGDCNNDGAVNEIDVLPIGVFFGQTGFARTQLGETTSWGPKQGYLWSDRRMTYADADGNGIINADDALVIEINWGRTHLWGESTFQPGFDYRDYGDNFAEFRQEIDVSEGSEQGQRMTEVLNSIAEDNAIPGRYQLFPNYPNPFNPQTRIDYALPQGTVVRLTVHNVLGQTVRTLVHEYQSAGFKHVLWDGTDDQRKQVSTGVYFYRLETTEFSEIRKMLKMQ